MFASIAKLRGWSVQAFDDFEEAVTWLSGAENEPFAAETEITPRAKKVPVRKLKRLKASSKPASQPSIRIKSTTSPRRDVMQPRTSKKPTASARAAMTAMAIALMAAMARQI
jgi:hypothetical protein